MLRRSDRFKVEHAAGGKVAVGVSVYRRLSARRTGRLVAAVMERDDFEWVKVSKEQP